MTLRSSDILCADQKMLEFRYSEIVIKNINSDGQQLHQYHLIEQSPRILSH
jgi:hypothetical protein